MKRIALAALVALAVAALLLAAFLPGVTERALQTTRAHAPYAIRPEVAALHEAIFVADLHSDSLLWKRDLLQRSRRGHVDFPRLREGNVALQVLSTPTRVPATMARAQRYERNEAEAFDLISLWSFIARWPRATLSSPHARALHMAAKLDAFAAREPESVRIVRNAADLAALVDERRAGSRPTGTLLAIEGAHALDGKLENLSHLYDAGYRMVGLQHFFDNSLGGSLHGESRAGLTEFGREVVAASEAREMIVDVAHSSPAVVEDVLAMAKRPVVVSHTGFHGACAHPRNISDALMQKIARRGGLIGVGFWDAAACDTTPAGVARAIRFGVELVGVSHVALGSDYDGATHVDFDASELAALTQALLDEGLGEDQVRKVMGENLLRFLSNGLPAAS